MHSAVLTCSQHLKALEGWSLLFLQHANISESPHTIIRIMPPSRTLIALHLLIPVITAGFIIPNIGAPLDTQPYNILNAFCFPPAPGGNITYTDCLSAAVIFYSNRPALEAPESYSVTHTDPPDPSLKHPLVLPVTVQKDSCELTINYEDVIKPPERQTWQDGGDAREPDVLVKDLVDYCSEKKRYEGGWWKKPNKRGKDAQFKWVIELRHPEEGIVIA